MQTSGSITYNGHKLSEFVPQRTSFYVSQQDCHAAEITVRETLEFSSQCQGVGYLYGKVRCILHSCNHFFMTELCIKYKHFFVASNFLDMLMELSRREKRERIKPDEDIDIFLKVNEQLNKHCPILLLDNLNGYFCATCFL